MVGIQQFGPRSGENYNGEYVRQNFLELPELVTGHGELRDIYPGCSSGNTTSMMWRACDGRDGNRC